MVLQPAHMSEDEERSVWLTPFEIGEAEESFDLTCAHHRQYIFVHSGSGSAELDGWRTPLFPGEILFIPTRTVARLKLAPGARCYSFGITDSFLMSRVSAALAISFSDYSANFNTPRKSRPWGGPNEGADRDRLWSELSLASRRLGPPGDIAVAAYVILILFEKNNLYPASPVGPVDSVMNAESGQAPDPAVTVVVAFRALIEQHMTLHWRVKDYAVALGVKTIDLIKACRSVFATTPSALIRDRLLLDAKRRLIYSRESAAHIADELGFSDAAYFSRFFKRETGQSPLDYRRSGAGSLDSPTGGSESREPGPERRAGAQ